MSFAGRQLSRAARSYSHPDALVIADRCRSRPEPNTFWDNYGSELKYRLVHAAFRAEFVCFTSHL